MSITGILYETCPDNRCYKCDQYGHTAKICTTNIKRKPSQGFNRQQKGFREEYQEIVNNEQAVNIPVINQHYEKPPAENNQMDISPLPSPPHSPVVKDIEPSLSRRTYAANRV
jgi:hypothetical protein